jgi:hypothetical protein
MKKVIYSLLIMTAVGVVSCKKDITDLNVNPTRPPVAPSATLFDNAVVNLADVMASTNVNNNNFRLFSQYWTETIYRDETRYNLNQRSISDRWWAAMYRDVIKDLTEASKLAETETLALSANQIKNRKAINEILIVYAYYTLLTTFGDIPYTEALDIDKLQPKYDNANEVYGKIATRLDVALGNLVTTASGYGGADLLLGDDIDSWKMFANSLKFRMGMTIIDFDATKGSAMILASAANVPSSNDQNIMMQYLASPPNTNPVWEDLVQSGRHDFVAAKPFIDSLLKYNDPRIPFFFEQKVSGGGYAGQTPGVNASAINNFSAPSDLVASPEFPHTFFSYAEMEFLKAEAVERGIAVGGTAATHYNNAVTASILEWGGSTVDAVAYLAQPGVAYATAMGGYKQKIGLQAWFALYNRGYDAWTEWRRLDWPKLNSPSGALFADGETASVIKRMTYPVVEQNLNKGSYEAAATAIGKDQITQKLWFDKF